MAGWESECIVWNTAWRNLAGTNGRGVPVDVSQTMVEAKVGRGISLRTREVLGKSVDSVVPDHLAVLLPARSSRELGGNRYVERQPEKGHLPLDCQHRICLGVCWLEREERA